MSLKIFNDLMQKLFKHTDCLYNTACAYMYKRPQITTIQLYNINQTK